MVLEQSEEYPGKDVLEYIWYISVVVVCVLECRIARQRCIGIYLMYSVVVVCMLEQSEEYPGKDVLEYI